MGNSSEQGQDSSRHGVYPRKRGHRLEVVSCILILEITSKGSRIPTNQSFQATYSSHGTLKLPFLFCLSNT